MKRVVLISGHFIGSKRRAGFHWIADAFVRAGWHVTVVTVGFSQLSRLKADHRFRYGLTSRAGRIEHVAPGLDSYIWFTPFHPLNRLPAIAALVLGPIFRRYPNLAMPELESAVAAADLLVFESTSGLMLVDRFRTVAPKARLAYRVSDDLRLLRAHPVVLAAETRALPAFEIVSVPSAAIERRFAPAPNVRLRHHGLDTASFDRPSVDPYPADEATRAVFVGTAYLDTRFVEMAAMSLPSWEFHVIGPFGPISELPNVHAHGELPFDQTVPFIAHADVGLACLTDVPGADSFSDSLKIIQYTYARLPIVAPDHLGSTRPNVFAYRAGDAASIRSALLAARAMDRSTVDRSGIGSWTDLARELAGPDLWP